MVIKTQRIGREPIDPVGMHAFTEDAEGGQEISESDDEIVIYDVRNVGVFQSEINTFIRIGNLGFRLKQESIALPPKEDGGKRSADERRLIVHDFKSGMCVAPHEKRCVPRI